MKVCIGNSRPVLPGRQVDKQVTALIWVRLEGLQQRHVLNASTWKKSKDDDDVLNVKLHEEINQ